MAAQNKLVERITHQKGRIQTMLAPWLRSAPGQSTSQHKKPGQGIPVGLRFKVAAQKMRVLDDKHSQFVHPEKTAGLGLNLKMKFREVSKLTHINPKIQRKTASWSEVERVYPKLFSSEPSTPEEPGTMKRGSIIPRFTPTPTPEQLMASLRKNSNQVPDKPAAAPPVKKAPVQPRLDPRSKLFSRVEEVSANKSKPGMPKSEPEVQPRENPRPAASPTQQVQRQEEPAIEPTPTLPDLPTAKPTAQPEPEMSSESETALPLAPQQRQIETHVARRPAILDRQTTSKPPLEEKKTSVEAVKPVARPELAAKPVEPPVSTEPLDRLLIHEKTPIQERTEPVNFDSKEHNPQPPLAMPPAMPGQVASELPPQIPVAMAKPVVPAPSAPALPPVAQPKPAARFKPAADLPHALPVQKSTSSRSKPAVAKPVNRKPLSFPTVPKRASTSTVSRQIDTQIPVSSEPLAEDTDQPEPFRLLSAAPANILPAEPVRPVGAVEIPGPELPLRAPDLSQRPAQQPLPVSPSTEKSVTPPAQNVEPSAGRLENSLVERPAQQPSLQKNLQKRLQSSKTVAQREPVNLPLRNSPALPVKNRQNPPLILPQKYRRVEHGAKLTAKTVQRQIDSIKTPSAGSSAMPVVARKPGQPTASPVSGTAALPTASSGTPQTGRPSSAPISPFEPARLDLAYPPAIPAAPEKSPSSGVSDTVQRTIDDDLKGMASQVGQTVAARIPSSSDVRSMAQSALGINPAQGLSLTSLKSDAKDAAMSALGLGSGGAGAGGGDTQSGSGDSAQAESSTPGALNLEQIAEDVLPILKRLLEIDMLRSGG